MRKPSNLAKNLLLLFSCALPAFYGLGQIICNDLWLHLKTGAWIWSHRAIPHTQLYSFLLGEKEWIDHEWLFQTVIYPVFYLSGLNGLIIMRFLIVALILAIFFSVARRSSSYLVFSALTIILSVTIASSRFFIRPEIFSLLFTVCFIFMLKSYRGGRRIFLLLTLQILWNNLHGYSILGPLLVAVFILSKLIEAKVKLPFSWNENRLEGKALSRIIILLCFMVIASLVNPYFLKGAIYPFRILGAMASDSAGGGYLFSFVSELQRVHFSHILYLDRLTLLSATIIVFLFSLLLNIRRIDIFDLAVFVLFLFLSLKALRHIGMLALSLGILSLFNFGCPPNYPVFLRSKGRRLYQIILPKVLPVSVFIILIFNLFLIITSTFWTISTKYIYDLKGQAKGFLFGKDESSYSYPQGALGFIAENKIRGNIFNFFDNGAYLIFGLYPDCRVFIDGRTELYGQTLLKAANLIFSEPRLLDRISENLSIEGVVLPCHQESKTAGLFKYLYGKKKWRLVFFDGKSAVFLKDLPRYRGLIRENRIKLEDFHINPDRDLMKIAAERGYYPTPFINLGWFFYYIDIPEKALAAIEAAEEVYPEDYQLHSLKAVILDKLGRSKEALEEFVKAAGINPRHPASFKNIGVFYARNGQPQIAREYFKKGLEFNPGDKELTGCLKEIDKYITQ